MRHLLLGHSAASAPPRHGSRRAAAGVALMPADATAVVATLSVG